MAIDESFELPIEFTFINRSALDKSKSQMYLIRGFADIDHFTMLAFWNADEQQWFDSQMQSLKNIIHEHEISAIGVVTWPEM